MALVSKIDPEMVARRLTGWLAERFPDESDLQLLDVRVPKESGLSAETVMMRARWRENGADQEERLVVRIAPNGPGLYLDYDIAREARVMRAVAEHAAVAVPAVRWVEEDPAVLGAPFLVMEHVDGRVPLDDPPFTASGWVLELSDDQRRLMYDNGLTAMAAVHSVPIDGLRAAFDRPDLGPTLVDQHLGYVRAMAGWSTEGSANPVIEAGLAWLDAHRPSDTGPPCLCWGDGRPGNLAFAPDLSVAAVLDWEAATIAVPEYDLGWWRFAMRHHSAGMGLALPSGFPDDDAVVTRFEELSGRPVRDLEFWEILNAVRFCCIAARAAGLLIGAGMLPPDSTMALDNPAARLLAGSLGVQIQTGGGDYYVGNR